MFPACIPRNILWVHVRRASPQTAQELPGSEGEFPSQRAVAFSPSGDLVAISQVQFHERLHNSKRANFRQKSLPGQMGSLPGAPARAVCHTTWRPPLTPRPARVLQGCAIGTWKVTPGEGLVHVRTLGGAAAKGDVHPDNVASPPPPLDLSFEKSTVFGLQMVVGSRLVWEFYTDDGSWLHPKPSTRKPKP